ncbi:transposase [Pseudonocardiaceae bacterium YIM PH 21723]|nr:transposase [Pseudonocardiaceae bacterium YIM PH 21723]
MIQLVDLPTSLVPDQLWTVMEPLLPGPQARRQGGGPRRADERSALTAVVYALNSGCAWQRIPPCFGVSAPTAHRRFKEWTLADVWARLLASCAEKCPDAVQRERTAILVDAATLRAGLISPVCSPGSRIG